MSSFYDTDKPKNHATHTQSGSWDQIIFPRSFEFDSQRDIETVASQIRLTDGSSDGIFFPWRRKASAYPRHSTLGEFEIVRQRFIRRIIPYTSAKVTGVIEKDPTTGETVIRGTAHLGGGILIFIGAIFLVLYFIGAASDSVGVEIALFAGGLALVINVAVAIADRNHLVESIAWS